MGKDHTLFAIANGIVKYTHKRKKGFNEKVLVKKIANVVSK
jgi:ribosomal protein L27